jgi:trimethylamine--corrinoid protein Co-methyltransferase
MKSVRKITVSRDRRRLVLLPRISFLSQNDIEAIHSSSLEILEGTGVLVKNPQAVELLERAGCRVEAQVVHIPPSLVDECLKKAPSSIGLHKRDGCSKLKVGGDNVIYNPGSSVIYFLDRDTGEMRRVLTRDLVQLVKLVDALEYVHAQSTAIVPADVSDAISDLYRLYIILKNSSKPIVTGAFTKAGLIDMKRMLEAVVGPEELANAPRAIFDVCPSSPLMWSDVTCQNLMDCAKYDIPAEIISAPQMGATSPVSIAGTLVQINAEFLSGFVISQTMVSGAPVVYGGSPVAFDMRHLTAPDGAVETMIATCAAAEIGKYYGLPTHAYLGLTDSKVVDAQTGFESGLGLILAALARVNIVSGPGMLATENCQSLEKLVIDNEICGMAYRLVDGVSQGGSALATEIIAKVGPGGHFLAEKHTRENLLGEQFMPSDVFSRLTPDSWRKTGSKNTVDRAKEMVDKLLTDHVPKPLPQEAEKRLDNVFKEILARHGLPQPPSASKS